ncbi:MAG: M3 family oligoendopeptidase [Armatimonadota bacterium]|nr:M3 family oligoendopeptidase [Armatimonadota bacterium]
MKAELPRWDMSVVYPGLDSPEYERDFRSLVRAIDELEALFDELKIDRMETPLAPDLAASILERVVPLYNALNEQAWTLGAYVYAFVAVDSRDEYAQARLSELERQSVRLSKLGTRLTAWAGTQDVDALIERSEQAKQHAYWLQRARIAAAHMMSPAEEALATEMQLTGSNAWNKLYGNYTSQIQVEVELKGERQTLTMSMLRNLAYDPDREVRRAAYEAELRAWEQHALPIASALNAIKGETNLLMRKRGWESPLHASLFRNAIDEATLNAMLEAAHESFPIFRRYLHAKARLLGVERCAWYDLFAPVGKEPRQWEYHEAKQFIIEQFATYSQKLSDLARRAFEENWIDAPPQPGKRDGAFCMRLRRDESRILTNYKPAFGGMSTLAHELGHAYHNLCLAERTYLQRQTPMTLAETASIFCETIIRQAALRDADPDEQLAILEASLQGACQVVVDITSRFIFEKTVFERRNERELSAQELCAIMREAQLQTYGDGLDPNALHPYMWAAKPHYYSSTFYNYPYMFGLLFGLGLYARYLDDPDSFRARYDDLLSRTGMADAPTLAAEFGFDLRTPAFWRSALDTIRRDVERFESLVQARTV